MRMIPRLISRGTSHAVLLLRARGLASARRVKTRRLLDYDPLVGGHESAAYLAYREQMAYSWGEVCQACYTTLDNPPG